MLANLVKGLRCYRLCLVEGGEVVLKGSSLRFRLTVTITDTSILSIMSITSTFPPPHNPTLSVMILVGIRQGRNSTIDYDDDDEKL